MIICLFSILAWGWLNQHWVIAGLLILLISASFFTTWRWDLKVEQFYRIGDFVTVLFIGVLLFFAIAHTAKRPVFIVLEWLPIFFLPVLLAQLYSVRQLLPMGTLFYSKRKRDRLATMDFMIPYAAICWLASGIVKEPSLDYFVLSILGFSLILWSVRSKNNPLILWFMLVTLAGGLSYWGQQGVRQLHGVVTTQVMEWMMDWHTDPFKSTTSIGDIGKLKLSDKIEFRVKSSEALLLMQASYDRYLGPSWLATLRVFSNQPLDTAVDPKLPVRQIEFFQSLKRSTVLALPAGTVDIKGLEGATLRYTPLGAVKLTDAPDFINYQVGYTGVQVNKSYEFDLKVPEAHKDWITGIKQELNLQQQSPAAIAQAIKQYFQNNYYYTLFLGEEVDADQALRDFILKRKAGHCEYFAVASVFLLRSYGIPARLANGYAMQEYSESEQLYIVRRRHAHAWAIAQIDGSWQTVDSTPAEWLSIEEQHAELLQPVYDLFSRLYFSYKQWRYESALEDEEQEEALIWLIVGAVLILILIWRLYVSRRDLVRLNAENSSETLIFPGLDSELFILEKALAKTPDARLSNESIQAWAQRIDRTELTLISQLHYRYRFDNKHFSQQERIELQQAVERCL